MCNKIERGERKKKICSMRIIKGIKRAWTCLKGNNCGCIKFLVNKHKSINVLQNNED